MTATIITLIILAIVGFFIFLIVAGIKKAIRQHKERAYFKASSKPIK